MIILRITSGLGNQMFQYAFYTLLKEKYKDTEVLCDVTWFNANHEHHGYELESIFSGVDGSLFEIKKASTSQITRLSGKIPNFFKGSFSETFEKIRRYPNRILKDTLLPKRMPYIIDQFMGDIPDENVYGDDGSITNPFFDKIMNLDISKDYYIIGFFVEERYYSQIIDDIKKRLVFPKFSEDYNLEYEKLIKSSDSVSIHVRRGDYLSDIYKDKFITLGRDYYEKAVNYIENSIKEKCAAEGRDANIKYFIFSDDADFVKKEFEWIENKTIVTENTEKNSYRDMQLMSLCSHNIIANSTFSQWGALLNKNENHITVYPKVYMVDHDNEKKASPLWVRL